ncbi:MAG: plasmid pRiA4b ORF-3 family protein [Bacteroidota bacterium]
MTKKLYQIQIALKEIKPKIWRRLLVPSNMLLSDFHSVIQAVMGWYDFHLHQFVQGETYYTVKMADDDYWDEMGSVDYKKMKISDLLSFEKEKINYVYDFGDYWQHQITLEKILPFDVKGKYPVCVAGKMNCPPEDCGGASGYMDLLNILQQPEHEEYQGMLDWLGGSFDPAYFNLDEVNQRLS